MSCAYHTKCDVNYFLLTFFILLLRIPHLRFVVIGVPHLTDYVTENITHCHFCHGVVLWVKLDFCAWMLFDVSHPCNLSENVTHNKINYCFHTPSKINYSVYTHYIFYHLSITLTTHAITFVSVSRLDVKDSSTS